MSRVNSYASSGSSASRLSAMNERFELVLPTSVSDSKTQLHRKRYMPWSLDDATIISTAISASGWVATASSWKIRLYYAKNRAPTEKISKDREFRIEPETENEKIRSIAISLDLLAVLTHRRLIVYEYREPGEGALETVYIDKTGIGTPKSVSILQVGSVSARITGFAWIAVGGEGRVKLFEYAYLSCWSPHRYRSTLNCLQTSSKIRIVAFSHFSPMNSFVVCGVASDDRMHCWDVRVQESSSPRIISSWELDYTSRQNEPPHRGEITSAAIFNSPSGRAYIFCTVDQRHGSQLLRSFIAPLEHSTNDNGPCTLQWRALPDSVAGRNALQGTATSNGRFLVTIEDGLIRLITLRPAYEGGLTCLEPEMKWSSELKVVARNVSGISLSVTEEDGSLNVLAVDGHGNLIRAHISVPGMPRPEPPAFVRITHGNVVSELPSIPPELPGAHIVRELQAGSSDDEIRVVAR